MFISQAPIISNLVQGLQEARLKLFVEVGAALQARAQESGCSRIDLAK